MTRIPILMYHSISNDNSFLSVNIKNFEEQIIFLKRLGYSSIDFPDINKDIENKIIITFDDGYKDNLINALPILERHGFKATFFIVTNFIGQKNFWDLGTSNYIEKQMLSIEDVQFIKNRGMSIGCHTKNHKNLTHLKYSEIVKEIMDAKYFLETQLNENIELFSYPYGKLNAKIFEFVSKNFKYSVSTIKSRFEPNSHNFNLIPRIHMKNKMSKIKLFFKLKTFIGDINYNDKQLYM